MPNFEDILFVKLNMDPLTEIDLRGLAWEFIQDKKRRRRKRNVEVSMKQEYFRGLFSQAKRRVRKVIQPENQFNEENVESDYE